MTSRRWGPVLESGPQGSNLGLTEQTEQTSVQNAGKTGSLLLVPPHVAVVCETPEHNHGYLQCGI